MSTQGIHTRFKPMHHKHALLRVAPETPASMPAAIGLCRRRASILVAVLLSAVANHAATINWTNTSGGNWSAPANWSPNALPGASDDVVIAANGTYTVVADVSSTISTLTVGGSTGQQTLNVAGGTLTINGAGTISSNGALAITTGTLAGTATIVSSGPVTWTGGTISGSGTLYVSGGLTMSGTDRKSLTGCTLVNLGTASWTGGDYYSGSTAVFSNAPAGIFNLTFDGFTGNYGGGRTFANAGTFNKTGGTATATFSEDAFNNSGTVNVQSGTLSLAGGASSGAFVIGSGTTLDFHTGTHTLGSGSSVSGAGTFSVSGGTVNVNGSYTVTGNHSFTGGTANYLGPYALTNGAMNVTGGTVNFNAGGVASPSTVSLGTSGTLGGSNLVSVTGLFTWADGQINGSGPLYANGGLVMNSAARKSLFGRTLINTATAAWSAGDYYSGSAAVFSNAPAGVFNLVFDGNTGNYGGGRTFANAGTFNKTAGTGIATFNEDNFNNTGLIVVQSGTLSVFSGTSSGAFVISNGATMNIVGGTHVFTNGASVSGGGTLLANGGTLNFEGQYNLSPGQMAITGSTVNFLGTGTAAPVTLVLGSGGNLSGSNTVSVAGLFTWTDGQINAPVTVNANGGLQMSSPARKSLFGTLVNTANATWSAGDYYSGSGAVLSNAPSGVFNLTFDGYTGNYGGNRTIANAGIFNKTAGTGTATFTDTAFNNSGVVNVQSGTLSVMGGVSSGLFTNAPGTTLDFNNGTHTLLPGSTVAGAGTFSVSGGTVNVNGNYSITGGHSFTGGTANFQGPYNLTTGAMNVAGGTINFNSGGTASPSSLTLGTSGTLGGSNLVSVSGVFTWTDGQITGAGAGSGPVYVNGGLNMSGQARKSLLARTLINAGTGTWSAGDYYSGSGAVLSNTPSGVFNLTFDGYTGNYGGGRTIANAGVFNKTGGTGTATFTDTAFNNSGVVNVQSGTLSVMGGVSSGLFTNAPGTTLDFNNGTHTLLPGSTVAGAGTFSVSGGTV